MTVRSGTATSDERPLEVVLAEHADDGVVVPAGALTLTEVAAAANEEHRIVQAAGMSMFEHAVRAGELLHNAREQVGRGEWARWRDANFDASGWTAGFYIRVYEHQSEIRERLGATPTLTAARELIADRSFRPIAPPEVQEEAARLAAEGVPFRQIAKQLGVSRQSARRYSDPAYRERIRGKANRSAPGTRRPAGPVQLASCFRAVGAAHQQHDTVRLILALAALVDAAESWARQLGGLDDGGGLHA